MSFVFSGGRASVSCSTASTKKSMICVSANRSSTEHMLVAATSSRSRRVAILWTFANSIWQRIRCRKNQVMKEFSCPQQYVQDVRKNLAKWDKIPGTIELAKSVFHGLQLQAKTYFDINHRSEPYHALQCSFLLDV